jgi:hypothetical protein
MRNYKDELEIIANDILEQNAYSKESIKPHYSNRDFMNTIIIFQTALMDKMYDNQDYDNMIFEEREKMAIKCGEDLRKLIFTYTNLDTHNVQEFL